MEIAFLILRNVPTSIKINTNASAQLIQMFLALSLSLANRIEEVKKPLLIIKMIVTQQVANYVSRQFHLYIYLVRHLNLFQTGFQVVSVISQLS